MYDYMNMKIFGVVVIIITIIVAGVIYQIQSEEQKQSKLDLFFEKTQIELEEKQNSDDVYVYPPEFFELFHVYVHKNQLRVNSDETQSPEILNFIPKMELKQTFGEIGLFDKSQNTVVIIPIFTANAYKVPSFYNYYDGSCSEICLTVSIQNRTSGFTSSNNGVKILKLLQYEMITDVDVDKNPDILKKYDKIILLHNEYVTKKQFDAITSHPNVIYLYPNALYAEIETDYEKNTMTLKKGHDYPEKNIKNGFGWEYDNSPMEYDQDCSKWEFYPINNGWMLNCYPEDTLLINNEEFLKQLKEF
ncbi:hypothetical protein BD31_I1502 [Candidatus Nitrosopumilus salaria BD31]|uniref:Uncharacterized protein n=2 Tax=Nitrosopumilus TaxID=338191 RepID=I3D3P2_9ARCH|nr:hypothetical protein BD31_I1502 [Candidatus Nitrosopumilus salaria BD31]